MSQVTLYHNSRCSKSRQTLALLEEQGHSVAVVEYLKTVPTREELQQIIAKLGIQPRDLLRNKEEEYQQAGLNDASLSDDQIINAMVAYPKLIERPIAIYGNKARIGRPPEQVLELFK